MQAGFYSRINNMITEEKIQEARRRLKRGVPQGEIENDLRNEGYTDSDIEKIYVPFRSSVMRSWYLLFGMVFLLAGFWSAVIAKELYSLVLIVAAAILLYMYYTETRKQERENMPHE